MARIEFTKCPLCGADCTSSMKEQNGNLTITCKCIENPDVNRAEILRLCNEIEDIACDIGNLTMNDVVYAEARMIFDKVKEIGKELTGDAGSKTD